MEVELKWWFCGCNQMIPETRQWQDGTIMIGLMSDY